MSRWRFYDGRVVLHSGGQVDGEGPLADWLRDRVRHRRGTAVILPGVYPPNHFSQLDLNADWTLQALALENARRFHARMETDWAGPWPEWVLELRKLPPTR